jgi:hypothetical protein
MRSRKATYKGIKIFSGTSSRPVRQGKFVGGHVHAFDPMILQSEVQRWLNENPGIEILHMQQSQHMQESSDNRLPWITITILYSESITS